jgi:hypothetical protein
VCPSRTNGAAFGHAVGAADRGDFLRRNTARVAHSIESSILAQRHLHYHVLCPVKVPQEQGRTFECVATGHNAKHKLATTPFLVTIQNKRGYVTYVGK